MKRECLIIVLFLLSAINFVQASTVDRSGRWTPSHILWTIVEETELQTIDEQDDCMFDNQQTEYFSNRTVAACLLLHKGSFYDAADIIKSFDDGVHKFSEKSQAQLEGIISCIEEKIKNRQDEMMFKDNQALALCKKELGFVRKAIYYVVALRQYPSWMSLKDLLSNPHTPDQVRLKSQKEWEFFIQAYK